MEVTGVFETVRGGVSGVIGFLSSIRLYLGSFSFSLWDAMLVFFVLTVFSSALFNRKDNDK